MPMLDNIAQHTPPSFDLDVVFERLLDKVYALLSSLPSLLLALLVVWLGWKLGGLLSRRAAIDWRASFSGSRSSFQWRTSSGGRNSPEKIPCQRQVLNSRKYGPLPERM